jgi:hypothetical protein
MALSMITKIAFLSPHDDSGLFGGKLVENGSVKTSDRRAGYWKGSSKAYARFPLVRGLPSTWEKTRASRRAFDGFPS